MFRPVSLSSEPRCKYIVQHTIMHHVYGFCIDIIKLVVQFLIEAWLNYAERVSEAGGLEAVGSLIKSQRPGRLQCPKRPAFSDLPNDGVLLPASVDDNYRLIGVSMALAGSPSLSKFF